MADVFTFHVYDDRTIQYTLAEPIMLEDANVTQFEFRIPKILNGLDMTNWAWWFVYENASTEKYSVPLILSDDEDDPENYSLATYTVDTGMSGKAGRIRFALEVIDADATTSEILHEWHTRTYTTNVINTLQGNERAFTPSEYDLISAKLEEIMEAISEGVGGGTSDDIENASTVTGSTVTDALNSLSDEIASKQDALTFDNSPTSGSSNPVKSGGVYTALQSKQNALTFDNAPTSGSSNPVKSSGIYAALQSKAGTSTATTSANGLMSSTDKGRLDTLYADYSSAITALGV